MINLKGRSASWSVKANCNICMSKQLTTELSCSEWFVTSNSPSKEQPAFVVLIGCPYRLREAFFWFKNIPCSDSKEPLIDYMSRFKRLQQWQVNWCIPRILYSALKKLNRFIDIFPTVSRGNSCRTSELCSINCVFLLWLFEQRWSNNRLTGISCLSVSVLMFQSPKLLNWLDEIWYWDSKLSAIERKSFSVLPKTSSLRRCVVAKFAQFNEQSKLVYVTWYLFV
jgi:hypothetical protein